MSNQLDLTSLRDALASLRRGLARWQAHAQALLVLLQIRDHSDA